MFLGLGWARDDLWGKVLALLTNYDFFVSSKNLHMWRQLVKNGETPGSYMAIYGFSAEMKTQLYNKLKKHMHQNAQRLQTTPKKTKKHTPGPNHIQQVHHTPQKKTNKKHKKNHKKTTWSFRLFYSKQISIQVPSSNRSKKKNPPKSVISCHPLNGGTLITGGTWRFSRLGRFFCGFRRCSFFFPSSHILRWWAFGVSNHRNETQSI